jgi:hypothetical protein
MPDPDSNPLRLLHEVGRILDREGVSWAAIGALAVAYHGFVRASLDADAIVTFKGSRTDLERLGSSLRAQGWKVDVRKGEPGDPLGYVIRILDAGENQVDLIGGISRMDSTLFDRAITDELEGRSMRIVSPEDLIALKVFAGSAQDLADAAAVVEIQGDALNRNLIHDLCGRFGPEEKKRAQKLFGPDSAA